MEKYNIVLKAHPRLKGSITRAWTYAHNPPELCTVDEVASRLEHLDNVYQEFTHSTQTLYSYAEQEGYVDPTEEFLNYEEKYLCARGKLLALKRSLAPSADRRDSTDAFSRFAEQQVTFLDRLSNVTTHSVTSPGSELPKINIPAFTGNYKDWPSFKDLFVSSIDSKRNLTNTQKFHYLKSLLKDESANLVRHIPVTESSYQTAWARLEDRYSRPKQIVNSFMETFFALPSAANENCGLLRKIADGANEVIRGLDSIQQGERDCWLIYILLAKIDSESRRAWIQESKDSPTSTLEEFFEFLDSRCEELELSQRKSSSLVKHSNFGKSSNVPRTLVSLDAQIQRCNKCNSSEHNIFKCPTFLALSADDRRLFVKSKPLCFNCLKSGHTSYACKSKFRCRECHKRHHSLVHPTLNSSDNPKVPAPLLDVSPPDNPWSAAAHISRPMPSNSLHSLESSRTADICTQQGKALLPTALVDVRDSESRYVPCRVLLDCASELSYISERCAQRLGHSRSSSHIIVSGISSIQAETTRGRIFLLLRSRVNQQSIKCNVHVLKNITSALPRGAIDSAFMTFLKDLPLADPTFNEFLHIDILIGAEYIWNIFNFDKVFDSRGNIVAVSTIFGWVVTSTFPAEDSRLVSSFVTLIDIDHSLRNFWEIEEVNQRALIDPADVYVEQHFCKTHSRHNDGKYMVELPFKTEGIKFSDTIHGALCRFNAVEHRLLRNGNLRSQYVDFMREYISLGHMREIKEKSLEVLDGKLFYLPHHPVLGQKLRVVFDGSFQDSKGASLNSTLHTGPRIQRNLFEVCLRFRLHQFVFSADIVKMFRQIWLADQHRNYQRVLWREDPTQPLKHFQLCTVTYGTSCAPFLAVRVLKQLALDYQDTYPTASKVLLEDFYVDDVLTGASSEQGLVEIRDELIKLLSCAGLDLRKWVSNSKMVTCDFNERSEHNIFKTSEHDTTKVLGLYWRQLGDMLAYKVSLEKLAPATKRQVLSDVSRIFDPLGLLAPIVIQFKILFQELWLHDLTWDQPLPQHLSEPWLKYREDLIHVTDLKINRFICNSNEPLELHGFSDASIRAYSAVVYSRTKDEFGATRACILASKTRVAPLKQISLPRLELCGALLLSRLLKSIKCALPNPQLSIRAWSDSMVVLSWLSKPPITFKTFVANRTAEILETLPRNIWGHVRSADNPADCASRGMMSTKLIDYELWWKGPSWLYNDNALKECIANGTTHQHHHALYEDEEIRRKTFNMVTTENQDTNVLHRLAERISSWRKLFRIVAYMLRFLRKIRLPKDKQVQIPLSIDEINEARIRCLRFAQNCFDDEKSCLQQHKALKRNSKLTKLTPFLDENQLIRVGGRIKNSILDADAQHPIILPKHNRITYLILLDAHERNLHPGVASLFVIVRQVYWVFGARNLIRSITARCVKCFRQRQITTQQLMSDLPTVRSRQAHPFEKSGCDYAGPLTLKLYQGRNARTSKGYICLFVCLVTSAIHLELATDLSTECFLAALRRFMSRRGKCSEIFSDNGRNFIGAPHALDEMHKQIMSQGHNEIVSASLAEDGIRWSYIPPHAHHWGGMWESAIRSVKLHLRRVVGTTILTFEQMNTLLAQVEAVVNSRPLGSVSDSELNYLSPAHFLIGRPYTMIPEGNLDEVNTLRLGYWQHVQSMYQGFWRRWHQEYLTSLQQRPKWNQQKPNLVVGNIVIMKEPNTPPAKWLLAKVIDICPGSDGLVRAVRLRTTRGDVTRPITKIAVLPIF